MQEISKILDEMPDKQPAAKWRKYIKGNVKHHELVSMLYKVKSIYNEQILSAENDEGEEQENYQRKDSCSTVLYIYLFIYMYIFNFSWQHKT